MNATPVINLMSNVELNVNDILRKKLICYFKKKKIMTFVN